MKKPKRPPKGSKTKCKRTSWKSACESERRVSRDRLTETIKQSNELSILRCKLDSTEADKRILQEMLDGANNGRKTAEDYYDVMRAERDKFCADLKIAQANLFAAENKLDDAAQKVRELEQERDRKLCQAWDMLGEEQKRRKLPPIETTCQMGYSESKDSK